jgi:hypothetical protein
MVTSMMFNLGWTGTLVTVLHGSSDKQVTNYVLHVKPGMTNS